MFRRVRESVSKSRTGEIPKPVPSSRSVQTPQPQRIRRRRKKRTTSDSRPRTLSSALLGGSGSTDDDLSVGTTITVETTRTARNENIKPTADSQKARQMATQLFVDQKSADPYDHPIEVLERAQSDITKLSIFLKEVKIDRQIAATFLQLIRGDNRNWEAIAVDILRQKARWESITLDDCSSSDPKDPYLDMIITYILSIDNCAWVHLSNMVLSSQASWALQSLAFSKSLTTLQLDLIDLTYAIPLLCQGLVHNTTMKGLITSRCGLNDDHLRQLLTQLPKNLEELRIFGNKCRGKGLAAITTLLQHTQHLRILDLSYQHVSPNDSDRFDISWMAGVLHRNETLQVLDLDNVGIDDVQLGHLVEALCVNDTLEEVMLNHNRITAAGIALLSSRFPDMKGLKKISMYSNLFDAPAVNGSLTGPPAEASPAQQQPAKRESTGSSQNRSSQNRSTHSRSSSSNHSRCNPPSQPRNSPSNRSSHSRSAPLPLPVDDDSDDDDHDEITVQTNGLPVEDDSSSEYVEEVVEDNSSVEEEVTLAEDEEADSVLGIIVS